MALDDTQALEAEDRQAAADLEAGAAMEAGKPAASPDPAPRPEKPAAVKPQAPAAEPKAPEYVQLTREQFSTFEAASRKTLSMEQQLQKAFGTLGSLQKTFNELKTGTPRGAPIEIPKDAFTELETDFPELAKHMRAGLEKTLRGATGTGPANAEIDPEKLRELVAEHAAKLRTDAEIEALEDAYPEWRGIVGAVDTSAGQQPDPNNPFRKWLAGKDEAYRARINGTTSASVLTRAIQLFEAETKAEPTPKPKQAQQRQAQLRAAVQPRGDGGQAAATASDDDDFEAGFRDR